MIEIKTEETYAKEIQQKSWLPEKWIKAYTEKPRYTSGNLAQIHEELGEKGVEINMVELKISKGYLTIVNIMS